MKAKKPKVVYLVYADNSKYGGGESVMAVAANRKTAALLLLGTPPWQRGQVRAFALSGR